MSKDIWHITNKNEDTTDIPKKENIVVLDGVLGCSCLWYGGEEPEPIFWENVKRWCYLDDLISSNERTRKALKITTNAIDEILYLDSGKFCKEPAEMWKIAKSAKDKITALEQKD